ncbi:unnamed protein product [Clonostachys rhizophaga]|uniref:Zn(2)-C6 fungal-type domain-containing protein n=1 Tax=Clonostachys rhizophaga TaxID=160324 RepID=A0A9N9VKG9_9HYPO|nr:unnamed protein product [Clonostachys rhizophaga]
MAPTIPTSANSGMFHTCPKVQGVTPRKPSSDSADGGRANGNTGSKRITTPHACAECKRRKIRCDGQQPCGQCLSSRAPKRCFYDKHRQRVIPSRKRLTTSRTLEALSQQLEECRSIVKKLFPGDEISSLLPLSRQELLALLDRPVINNPNGLPSPPPNTSPVGPEPSLCNVSESTISPIDQVTTQGIEWEEDESSRVSIASEVDDPSVLSMDRQASYLGASSIKAALMVMLKVQPQLRHSLAPPLNSVEMANNFPVIRQPPAAPKDSSRIPWSWKGQTLIDAYFKRIHVFVPMLDEAAFRTDYLEGQRCDASWLALLNMVFAMGSIVAMKSDDFNHINYYNRAMEHVTIDSLGNSHIETVQALIIIGGYYLHYINRPNMANSILGAAIRMASTLGLYRESITQGACDVAAAETRRRTWWSLFCVDTWATTTMGRPSFGRWGPAINTQPPEFSAGQRDSAHRAGILPLIENIKFCKIATQIQDMLAITPLLRADDRCNMDNKLLNWYNNLPWLLRTTDPCAEPLYIARCIMKWRYQNLRMLLHRPVLLAMANNGMGPQMAEQDLASLETCREMAKATVEDISREWTRNQMSGWNAVTFLYQAAMIPLVSIFWEWNSMQVPEWQKQIETILGLLKSMEDWSLAARRSHEVVWRMYEASRQPSVMRGDSQLQVTTDPNLLASADEFHLSPIGIDTDDMVGFLDQPGIWDLDSGNCWAPGNQISMATTNGMCEIDEGMLAIDYSALGGQEAMMEGTMWTQ